MSRYASKAELVGVIRQTIFAAGIDPERVYMARVLRDLDLMGDNYYGWTVRDPGVSPVDVARRHMRPAPPFRPSVCQHEDDDHSHVTDMPDPRDDALDRIAEIVREGVLERRETGKPIWTMKDAIARILRETGRL
jgi:hypothetical protein